MAKVEIIRKELVWDVFNANTYKKIGRVKNGLTNDVYFEDGFDEKILKKMYPVFHSKFHEVSLEDFVKNWFSYSCYASVGEGYLYNTIEDFKQAQKEREYLFYITSRYVIRKETVKADYFDVQDYGCDDTYVVAAFPDYNSAVEYCNKENISINNIVPQKWGYHESLD